MLSNLYNKTYTIINRIPRDENTVAAGSYVKHKLDMCSKRGGVYDKSSGTMVYKDNSWTAYIGDWEDYRPPHWLEGGYYQISEEEKADYFTVAVGDLLIFSDITDEVPANLNEFNALKEKYKDIGGIISSVEVFIQYKTNGEPWKTNHIEAIKG